MHGFSTEREPGLIGGAIGGAHRVGVDSHDDLAVPILDAADEMWLWTARKAADASGRLT